MKRVAAAAVALLLCAGAACSKKSAAPPSGPLPTGTGTCSPVTTVPDEGRGHVQFGVPVQYKANPPSSGKHWPQPARTGAYAPDQTPAKEQLVHNQEHGHVIFWVEPGMSTAVRDALAAVILSDAQRGVLVTEQGLPTPVVFTAWDRRQECPLGSDLVAQASAFFARFKGKGPEGDLPGTAMS